MNKKVLETRDEISETNRNSWFAESEVTKEQNRQDTLTTQIEQLKKDIEARKNAIAERKFIQFRNVAFITSSKCGINNSLLKIARRRTDSIA